MFNEAEYMTPEQRLRRAAEILWNGIARMEMVRLGLLPAPKPLRSPSAADRKLAEELNIVEYVRSNRSTRIFDICSHFKMSRTTAHRRLRRLVARGLLSRTGIAGAVKYSVATANT